MCPVPWTEDWEFDEPSFRSAVHALRTNLTSSIYIFGTAGEGYAVSDSQFECIARTFRDEMAGEPRAMLGIISLSLPTIIERIVLGRELGFREFQISLPSWGALNDREVDLFFRETCGRFPDCSFLHYNLPRVKRVLRGVEYRRLVCAHPNLVAVKMGGAASSAQSDVATSAPELQCFFTEMGYAEFRDCFECGLLASISTIHFARCREYHAARGTRLADLRDELRQIQHAMKAIVGDEAHMNGAFDKMYIKLHKTPFPLRLLPPYQSTSNTTFERFRTAIPTAWRV
jgi:dihydrodipicolinate synthase/N-acetylneuraminate lyase